MTPQLSFLGRVASLRLDAPERRNALTPDDLRALAGALAEIDRSDVDVAILSGAGETFCAGYDLRSLRAEIGGTVTGGAQRDFAQVVDALENLRVPTICAMRGGAFGGGSDLALACDFRIGTPATVVAVPAATFGLQFYYGGLRRYVERLGVDVAKRVFLLAERLDADELLRVGFVQTIVSAGDLDETVANIAERLGANASEAVRGLKRSLNAIARHAAQPDVVDDAYADSLRSVEARARVRR